MTEEVGLQNVALRVLGWEMFSRIGDRRSFEEAFRSGIESIDGFKMPGLYRVPDFEIREQLGKKGTRSFDRHTALFVKATSNVIEKLNLEPDVLQSAALLNGTATGSLSSIQDFLLDTYRLAKPYFVNPAHMPNTVINCAAGQCAIWHKIRGPNITVSSGAESFQAAFRMAHRWAARDYARNFVVGAVEESTDATDQLRTIYSRETGRTLDAAEGAAAWVCEAVSRDDVGAERDDLVLASHVLTMRDQRADRLGKIVQKSLIGGDLDATDISVVITNTAVERIDIATHFGNFFPPGTQLYDAESVFGKTYSASGAMQLALLGAHLMPGEHGLTISSSDNGTTACMLFRKGQ